MTEIIITQPSIFEILDNIIIDIGIIFSISFGFFRFIVAIFTYDKDKEKPDFKITTKGIIVVVSIVAFLVLTIDSSTMKFLSDITFENVSVYKTESKLERNNNGKYTFYDEDDKIVFKPNSLQKLYLDEYFIDNECEIEYYKQSRKVKKITLLQ